MYSTTYYSKIYRDFFALDFELPRGVVYFYELHEDVILALRHEEYFDILVAYTQALFDSEAYSKYVLMANVVIEESLLQYSKLSDGTDVFEDTLFHKSIAHYHLAQYDDAAYLLHELMRINPSENAYSSALKKCLRNKESKYAQRVRASAILCFLSAAIVIAFEVIIVRNFYSQYQTNIEWFRILLFLAGISIIAIDYALRTWRAHYYVETLKASVLAQKNKF